MNDDRPVLNNNTVFKSALEPVLYSECDYRLFWLVAGLCIMASFYLFALFPIPRSLYDIGIVVCVFFCARWGLRILAKYDPLAVPVYLRHLKWPDYLPARGKILNRRNSFPLLKRGTR